MREIDLLESSVQDIRCGGAVLPSYIVRLELGDRKRTRRSVPSRNLVDYCNGIFVSAPSHEILRALVQRKHKSHHEQNHPYPADSDEEVPPSHVLAARARFGVLLTGQVAEERPRNECRHDLREGPEDR